MEVVGINFYYLFLNFLVLGFWILLDVVALWQLRSRQLSDAARAVWAVVIVFAPIIGAIAFFITQPGKTKST